MANDNGPRPITGQQVQYVALFLTSKVRPDFKPIPGVPAMHGGMNIVGSASFRTSLELATFVAGCSSFFNINGQRDNDADHLAPQNIALPFLDGLDDTDTTLEVRGLLLVAAVPELEVLDIEASKLLISGVGGDMWSDRHFSYAVRLQFLFDKLSCLGEEAHKIKGERLRVEHEAGFVVNTIGLLQHFVANQQRMVNPVVSAAQEPPAPAPEPAQPAPASETETELVMTHTEVNTGAAEPAQVAAVSPASDEPQPAMSTTKHDGPTVVAFTDGGVTGDLMVEALTAARKAHPAIRQAVICDANDRANLCKLLKASSALVRPETIEALSTLHELWKSGTELLPARSAGGVMPSKRAKTVKTAEELADLDSLMTTVTETLVLIGNLGSEDYALLIDLFDASTDTLAD